jgi:hypothetical protein
MFSSGFKKIDQQNFVVGAKCGISYEYYIFFSRLSNLTILDNFDNFFYNPPGKNSEACVTLFYFTRPHLLNLFPCQGHFVNPGRGDRAPNCFACGTPKTGIVSNDTLRHGNTIGIPDCLVATLVDSPVAASPISGNKSVDCHYTLRVDLTSP